MEHVKATSAAVAVKQAEIDGIDAQIERAKAVINAGIPGQSGIETLQSQREAEIGQAFIENRPPALATIDKSIAKLEKEAVDARASIAGASSALNVLTRQAAQAAAEMQPLEAAQDAAIDAYAAEKDAESVQMMNAGIAAIHAAFNHMAAAETVRRSAPAQPQARLWQHRLHILSNQAFNVRIDCGPQLDALKTELAAAGVKNPGVQRPVVRVRPVPTVHTDPVVRVTMAEPTNDKERQHLAQYGSVVRTHQG